MSPLIDPRAQQFAAAITTVVLAGALLSAPGSLGIALLALQGALFATAVWAGVQRTPVAAIYRSAVRPRLAPPSHLEDATPPRFAQGVGLVFVLAALLGFLTGAETFGYVATAAALSAALLNATMGLCLGCELYLLGRHALAALDPTKFTTTRTTTQTRSTT
jgi:hypothetical protein